MRTATSDWNRSATKRFLTLLAFAVLLMHVPKDAAAQSDKIPGMSLGSFAVDNNGSAQYSIPIIVPPGTAGMAPKLSLAYSSQGQNGLLGMGWSLTGLSAIHRCPRTIAQDNFKGGINFDSGDRFCLDGQRLIALVDGTDGGDQKEYRTEIDSFLKVFSYGTAGSGPQYWIVKNKAGQTIEFGNDTTGNSRIEAQGKTSVRVWALNKITDASGNTLTVTYDEESTNGDYRPIEIDYPGNTGGNPCSVRCVKFLYEDRPDKTPLYVAGSVVKMMKRLTTIQTYAPPPQGGAAVLVREYRLPYETSTSTGRSRLGSITECAGDGSCLPASTFSYQNEVLGVFSSDIVSRPQGWDSSKVWSGDWNGDGKTDLVSSSNGKFYFAISNGDGTYSYPSPSGVPHPAGWDVTKVWVGDFNGDAKQELVSSNNSQFIFAFFTFVGNTVTVQTNPTPTANHPTGWDVTKVWVGDFNGDAKQDLVSSNSSQFIFAIFTFTNSNGNWSVSIQTNPTPTASHPNGWNSLKVWAGDFNGDGKQDLVSSNNGQFYFAFYTFASDNSSVTVQSPPPAPHPQGWDVTKVWIGDWNGDGLSDLASSNNNQIILAISKGDGTIQNPAPAPSQPPGWNSAAVWVGDLNGDGKSDFLSHNNPNFIYAFSNGDGTITPLTLTDADQFANSPVSVGDFDGNGISDVVSQNNGKFITVVFNENNDLPDLLTSVTTNLGGKIDVVYKPITDSTVYTKDNDAVYPVQDVQGPIYVVDNYTASTNDGTGTSYNFTYDYAGAKMHLLGRGWLGFRQTIGVDQTAGAQNIHVFRQVDPATHVVDFPYVGMLDRSQIKDLQGNIFAQVKNEYQVPAPQTQQNQPKVVFAARTREVKDQCDGITGTQVTSACLETAQTFEYDADAPGGKTFGNLVHTLYEGDVVDTLDQRHERTEFVVDANSWLHRPKHTRLLDTNNVVLREKWLYYDDQPYGLLGSRGLLTKEESSLAGGQGNSGNPANTYHYDSFGNRDSATDPIGCTTKTVSFDSTNTFPTKVQRCYNNPIPNLIHTTKFTYDPRFGTKTSETGPCICADPTSPPDPQTIFTFDTFGRLAKVVGPLDTTSTYGSESRFYLNWGDPANQRIQSLKTKDHGTATVISREDYFDGLGRFDFINSTGPNDPNTGQPRNIVDQSFYDSRGLIATKTPSRFDTDPPLTFWEYTYDVMGRQIQVDHPDDRFSQVIYEPAKVTLIDERGKQKIKYLDGYGQVERIEEKNGSDTYTTNYEYDAAGLLFHVENHVHHHTRIKYDSLGRKIAMCDPNMGAGPNTTTCDTITPGSWVYTYDKAGNLKTQANTKLKPLGQALSFDYDSHSRMTKKTYPDASHIDFTYDQGANAVGRLTHVADLNQMATDFTYDAMGRVIQTQRIIDVLTGLTYTMSQNYNALSKVIDETFPDLDGATYTYNEAGWLKRIFDGTSDYVTNIDYNARGLKDKIAYNNGVVTNFNYFDDNPPPTGQFINFALQNRTTTGPGAPTGNLQNLSYTYDEVGNVKTIVDPLFTASRNFAYDDLSRLTSASGTFGGTNQSQTACAYSFDAIGNLLNKCGITYSYDDPNHPSFVTGRSDGKTYTADINGNTQSGDGRTFVWTADNRVLSVTNGSGTTSMDYDYTGTRVKKNGPLGLVLYPFAGYEIGPDGTKTKYFKAGTELLAAKQVKTTGDKKKLFYHNDHLGGINVITDDDPAHNGARQQLNEYDPWGKVSRTEGNVEPERRFTGQILDPESGLYYYGARYYDPELARFISPDPIVPSPGDPQSLNRYSYVRNNPVKYIDPTGHGFWSNIGNFFKNLFRQPEQLFLAAITGGLSIIVQAIAAGIGGAGGIAFAGIMGGPLAALVAANLPGVSGGLEFLGGAMMLASGNPAGILLMTAGGLSFCKAKGCQIASRVFGFAGAVAGMAWSSGSGSTGAPGEGTGPVGEQFASQQGEGVRDASQVHDVDLLGRVTFAEAARQYDVPNAMEAVASVVRNRVESGLFGNTYADIIYQKGQFDSVGGPLWRAAGNPAGLTGPNATAYARALTVAESVYYGKTPDPTGGALYFHSGGAVGWFSRASQAGRITSTKEIPPFTFYK